MKRSIHATSDGLALLRDVVVMVEYRSEADRHGRAVQHYREEREFAAAADHDPWWIDLGGEGAP